MPALLGPGLELVYAALTVPLFLNRVEGGFPTFMWSSRPQNDLAGFFQEQGIVFIDLLDAYVGADEEMFSDYTLHLTSHGSERTARYFSESLVEAGYL